MVGRARDALRVLRALVLVVMADVLLRWRGYDRTRRLGQRFARHPDGVPGEDARIETAVRMNLAASARLPWTATCLARSLALSFDLARAGIETEICIGVRAGGAPLDAHAWVEHRGHPINEVQSVVDQFARIQPGSRPL